MTAASAALPTEIVYVAVLATVTSQAGHKSKTVWKLTVWKLLVVIIITIIVFIIIYYYYYFSLFSYPPDVLNRRVFGPP